MGHGFNGSNGFTRIFFCVTYPSNVSYSLT